jgi:hypothetical protein
MARKPVIYGIAAAGLVGAIALAVFVAMPGGLSDSSAPGETNTQEMLGASTMPELKLYSGDIDPSTSQRITLAERSLDIPGSARRVLPLAARRAGYASVVGADLLCYHRPGD